MHYLWDENLETGHKSIDSQHKQLIEALNDIIDASEQGKSSDEIFKTLNFLTDYTVMHFSTEEKFMVDYNYPDYQKHKHIHDEFKVTVGDLTKMLFREGPTEILIAKTTATIGKWLIDHIMGDDFLMAAFVQAREEGGT